MKKLLLLLFLLGGVVAPSQAVVKASDVISRARTFLKDQSSDVTRQYFSDTVLLQFLNDGQREANAINWVLNSSYTFALVANTTEYAMPADFIAPVRVWLAPMGGTYGKLAATSFEQLDANNGNWTSANGTPNAYFMDRDSQTVYMGFYPAPGTSSTGTVIVYFVQNMPDLTSVDSVPFNGWSNLQPYVSMLAYYIAYRGFMTFEEPDTAKGYLDYWTQFLLIMRQGVNRQPDFNPPAAGNRGP